MRESRELLERLENEFNEIQSLQTQLTNQETETNRLSKALGDNAEAYQKQKAELTNQIKSLEEKVSTLKVDSDQFLGLEDRAEELENSLKRVKGKLKSWRELVEGRGRAEGGSKKKGWFW